MRLLGVIKSLPAITSRIGVGGSASSWVMKEFIAQIHTVSKVALHRKLNLASFLENHGRNSTSAIILSRTPLSDSSDFLLFQLVHNTQKSHFVFICSSQPFGCITIL
jgi:hypothetical protein